MVGEDPIQGTRVRRVLHGMVITVKQSGKIGRFSVSALIIQILSGLGLLAIATSVVDTLATYILPQSEAFSNRKYGELKLLHPSTTTPTTTVPPATKPKNTNTNKTTTKKKVM